MKFKKNNQFWKARTKHGKDKKFENPEILLSAAEEYFMWCDSNPLKEHKVSSGKKLTVNKMRAYTLKHLCIFLDISRETWNDYRKREEYTTVVERVETIIYTQKFQGAAAELLNANIISRELGLKDSSDVTTNGESLNEGFSNLVGRINKKKKENE